MFMVGVSLDFYRDNPMKEIKISETEINALAAWIEKHAEHIHIDRPEDSKSPAVKVIHCVLSLRTSYDRVVLPRLDAFVEKHPETRTVHELANLIASFPTPYEFMRQELKIDSKRKPKMLQQVVQYVCQIVQKTPNVSEEDSLKKWAVQAKPQDCYSLDIKYFKVAGFQYLRMLFGADTAKPDKHIRDFIYNIIDRSFSDIEAVLLLEAAAKSVGVSVRDVDAYIWIIGARKQMDNETDLNDELRPEYDETLQKNGIRGKYAEQYATGTNVVLLDPDVATAFPTKEAVNEALRTLLKKKNN